ncbi:MAG: TonB-dependent receptor [Steroidobacteraceae bacterium]
MTQSIPSTMKLALATAASAAAYQPATALAQDQASADSLEEVVITGSRIRRIDAESASPVLTVDREAIDQAGVATIGDLLQQIPTISGAAVNPATNNGGGAGASHVELRGLLPERTLVLLNGRRFGFVSNVADTGASAVDVNTIPVSMIERVEVLKEGAGAVYGSDAVAGVVNFITKKHVDGLELSYDFGETGKSDGQRQAVSLTWGTESERGNIMLGGTWNKQESISAGDRDFSRSALYLYGSVFEGGSSRTPTGRIFFDAGSPLANQYGCTSVTRADGTSGSSLSDYRCFVTTGNNSDFFNYQPFNLLMTPQERGSIFTLADYDINEHIQFYAEAMFNTTRSGFQIAALPFDSRNDNIVISAQSVYNPFGIDFGGGPQANGTLNPNALWRLLALGNRGSEFSSDTSQTNLGLRGDLGESAWNWEVGIGYGRTQQETTTSGYLYSPAATQAFGPSFIDGSGNAVCGTPAAPILNCTPVNVFNLADPSQTAALATISAAYTQKFSYATRIARAGLDGDVFNMPAGPAKLAVGAEYRDQSLSFDTDFLTQASAPNFDTCLLAQETCSGDQAGGYDVSELYAEIFLPLLADRPGVHALNLTLGTRYSDYSNFGNTTNSMAKLEYRPVADLLIRGTYSELFRAPTIVDLFRAPSATAPTFNDPCVGLTAAQVTANPNLALACQNVPQDGTFAQPNSQITGILIGNPDLQPETGDVLTLGFVFEPSAMLKGLSVNIDYWKYSLDNVINALDVNTAAQQCVVSGDPQFCGQIVRFQDGSIRQIKQPSVNLGTLETDGIDFGITYRFETERAGAFRVGLDATHLTKFDNVPAPGAATTRVAGTFDRQFGNYAKYRGTLSLGWKLREVDALLSARYIDKIRLDDPDGAPGIQPALQIPSFTYVDMTVGYKFRDKTTVRVGVDNLTDKTPPILYQNNVINSNTDVATYDTIGRAYWLTLKHNF